MTELSGTWVHEEKTRGRASNDFKSLKSIVLISRKYGLDPKLLLKALVEASRNKTCHYGSLNISCREVKQDFVTFLLTNEDNVVSQFPMKLELLRDQDFLKNSIGNFPISNYAKTSPLPTERRINELRFGMKRISVVAKIIEIPPKKLVITEFGNQLYVSNVRIADGTGSIRLSLWDGQIDEVHVGDEVRVENCYVACFAGEPQLRVGRNSTISVV